MLPLILSQQPIMITSELTVFYARDDVSKVIPGSFLIQGHIRWNVKYRSKNMPEKNFET